jgi:hypothetical protein
MQPLFESLETRTLFSVTPIVAGPPADPTSAISITPFVALKKMIGTWKGSLTVVGIHSRPCKLVITKQTGSGKITGILTTPQDPTIHVALTGKVKSNGKVSITLVGSHLAGPINGTGTGKLKSGGKAITFTMVWSQNGATFPGSLTLKKA